jgi:oxygen-independent coproporphyrinogen III oxidase
LVFPIDVGLYVHVAFCRKKCYYCDFNTYAGLDRLIDAYVAALVSEIRDLPPTLPGHHRDPLPFTIGSIFLGGGTPSMLTVGQIAEILAASHHWVIDPEAEVTIEANPDDPTVDYLRALRRLGVNRLSFGVQSFDDGMLKRLGRRHDARAARVAYDRARTAGFDNVSLDLMFALPGQTLAQWLATLDEAIALRPDHLSVYNLTIEEGTQFGAWAAKGTLTVPDDDQAADMYEEAIERLDANGYRQYEISNWASADSSHETRARHNLRYWKNLPYFGVGAGAHSSYHDLRYANLRSPATYIKRVAARESVVDSVESIGRALQMAETMILGLRLNEGIEIDAFRQRFGAGPDEVYPELLRNLRDMQLLTSDEDQIRLTYRGRLVGNDVFCRFLPMDDQ